MMAKIFEEIEDLSQLKRESKVNHWLAFIFLILLMTVGYYINWMGYIASFIVALHFLNQKRYFDTKYYIIKNFIELEKKIDGKT